MPRTIVKPAARSLIVAPRMPNPPSGHPFQGDGWIVLDCGVPGCGWNWMGERVLADGARKDHYRQHHASAAVAGVFRINDPTVRREAHVR